jgi:hypothetical protein
MRTLLQLQDGSSDASVWPRRPIQVISLTLDEGDELWASLFVRRVGGGAWEEMGGSPEAGGGTEDVPCAMLTCVVLCSVVVM